MLFMTIGFGMGLSIWQSHCSSITLFVINVAMQFGEASWEEIAHSPLKNGGGGGGDM